MEKKYTKDNITVVWKPTLCEHSKVCSRGLPTVFNPKNRPWIDLNGAEIKDIVSLVNKCPSGALSIENENKPINTSNTSSVKITIKKGGALRISGPVEIIDANGNTIHRDRASLCRCGQSKLQPYCDGSHKALENFE